MKEKGQNIYKWLPLLISSMSVILIISSAIWIIFNTESLALRNSLARWTVVSLEASLLLMLFGIGLGRNTFRTIWLDLSRRGLFILAAILVAGFLLLVLAVPRTNRIYYDEHIYENIGQNIAWTGKSFMCDEGNAEYGEYRPFWTEYNKQPNGHPFLLSLFFQVFGTSEWVAHFANNISYIIAIAGIAGITLILFGSEISALFAAAFYAGIPMVLIWSNTAAAEPSAAAFTVIALLSACIYAKEPSLGTLAFMVGAIAFGVQFRPESIFLVVPAVLIIISVRPSLFMRRELYWAVALLALLVLPEVLHLYAVRNEGWGTSSERFSWSIFTQNLRVNGPFYYKNVRYPLIFTVLAAIGLLWLRDWKAKTPLSAWFLYSWGIFLFFYAGSYEYGADVRFSLICAPPLAIFAGIGAGRLASLDLKTINSRALAAGLLIILAIQWIGFLPLIRAVGEEAVNARLDVECGREFAKLVPVDSIVLSHNPSMWLMWGKNAAQMSVATINRPHVDRDMFMRYKGGVYLHWNFWCNVPDPGQNQFCNNIKKQYVLSLVKAFDLRGFHYALYRLYPKGGPPNQTQPPVGLTPPQ